MKLYSKIYRQKWKIQGYAGDESLNFIKHTNIFRSKLWWNNRWCWRQNFESQVSESFRYHRFVWSISWNDHNNMLTVELFLCCFQYPNQRFSWAIRLHEIGQGYEECFTPKYSLPRLVGSAESEPQWRRTPGVPRGIRTTTEARPPKTCWRIRPR